MSDYHDQQARRAEVSYHRAQRQYDAMMPDDDDAPMKTCPTCEGSGELPDADPTFWQRIKRMLFGIESWVECPECNGECEIQMTWDDIADARADAADRAMDIERDGI